MARNSDRRVQAWMSKSARQGQDARFEVQDRPIDTLLIALLPNDRVRSECHTYALLSERAGVRARSKRQGMMILNYECLMKN